MKNLLLSTQFVFFILFNFFLFLSIIQYSGGISAFNSLNHDVPEYNQKEQFDPSLSRLNTISKLEKYCDSIFEYQNESDLNYQFDQEYPMIVSAAVSKKFYHGYSTYGYSNNFMALLLEPLTGKKASAIVIPDDIMKYPYAACSQQSIVMMELLKRKGFQTRKVGFYGGEKVGGHFCFEVFYKNSWHFFDPNQEPDANLLATYKRPDIAFIAKNDNILLAAYRHWNNPEKVKSMFKNYFYGKPNHFEAPNALLYQHATKFLSNFLWLFFLGAFIFVRKRYLRLTPSYNVRNRRIFIPKVTAKRSISYN